MEMERKIYRQAWHKLVGDSKPIFVTGPRQCGKTTLAFQIAKEYDSFSYLNYDVEGEILLKEPFFYEKKRRIGFSKPLVILDEIHKFRNWKAYIKKVYDRDHNDYDFLVTGSGRLDYYQRGGDSLIGRYEKTFMFPLSLSEFSSQNEIEAFLKNPLSLNMKSHNKKTFSLMNDLMNYSPFPEPFFKASKSFYRRWVDSSFTRVIKQDIQDSGGISDINKLMALIKILPEYVGSTASYSNIAGVLLVSPNTAKSWLDVLEAFHIMFSIMPYTRLSRAIIKERKYYFYNYAVLKDEGKLFENFIAFELFRMVKYWNMLGETEFELRYIRNKDNEEIDFVILSEGKPFLMIEAKVGDPSPSKSVFKFQNILNVPAVMLTKAADVEGLIKNDKNKILVISADRYISGLS
ncbi:MAG: ATP-binding protein [bacterium]